MSASLLQKSLKLFEDSQENKKKLTKKFKQQELKRKKHLRKNLETCNKNKNILKNLEQLQKLEESSCKFTQEISKKLLPKTVNSRDEIKLESKEESTAFTDQDFEEFEKEYFVS